MIAIVSSQWFEKSLRSTKTYHIIDVKQCARGHDTDHYDSKQQGAGVGVSIPVSGVGKPSVSASVSQQQMNSDYASVSEQSGIKAGSGGFDIDVKGNTDLKGGVIASEADASKNSLNTATLTYSDIENHANYDASSFAASGGYSFGGGDGDKSGIGKDQKGVANNTNPVPGTDLPKNDSGVTVAPPVAMAASSRSSSCVAIPPGHFTQRQCPHELCFPSTARVPLRAVTPCCSLGGLGGKFRNATTCSIRRRTIKVQTTARVKRGWGRLAIAIGRRISPASETGF
ncbi:hypothetical protein P9239_05765 [Caballeronia sp. LZ062]|nr:MULTISPECIES: hypothetical protein [unclassified Caballeronia]MDR5856736.1 hypothetical protein [Caballeronia sp. LZ050]MDR5869867.1 hypothetical protein [Caballeronia sp. LZ062]